MLVGLDLGATLHKVARARDPGLADLEVSTFPAVGRGALAFVRALAPTRVVLAGGRAPAAAAELAPIPTSVVSEFDAWARGGGIVAGRAGTPVADPYLLVSLGTGTSILLVDEGRATRVAGTALGGGTLVGLATLLLGVTGFDELVELAAGGSRRDVDLLLGDVYPDVAIPDFTAAHFGKLSSRRPEDLARAIVGMVAESVALMSAHQAMARRVACVVYGGSALARNPVLAEVLTTMTGCFGLRVLIPAEGAHAGAVGCLAMAFDG
jgi:type II pantothenate kinase